MGPEPIEALHRARVAVFGIGGVGGHCTEALARGGVGAIDLVDNDVVSLTNLNRQLIALHSTIGQPKVEVMARRIADINPDCRVTTYRQFYLPENADRFDLSRYDYVIDCIDTVTAKLELAQRCPRPRRPLISSMGTANKLDPTKFVVTDISKTTMCPLARILRKELRIRGIKHLKVVYSTEEALKPRTDLPDAQEAGSANVQIPSSNPFVRRRRTGAGRSGAEGSDGHGISAAHTTALPQGWRFLRKTAAPPAPRPESPRSRRSAPPGGHSGSAAPPPRRSKLPRYKMSSPFPPA